jgi:hypothetical protein
MSSRPELKLDWCSHEAAKYACEKWHYSGSAPQGKTVKIGVWESGVFIGVVMYNRQGIDLSTAYGLDRFESCELVRVALADHITPVSRIIRIGNLMLRSSCPRIRLIVSFADLAQNHHGGIYQAAGWVYSGQTGEHKSYLYKGKKLHSRMVRSSGIRLDFGKRVGCPRPQDCQVVIEPGKHRYLMPLDDEMRKRIEPLRKPYPKRAGGVAGDTSANHAGEGGSIPTPALSDTP